MTPKAFGASITAMYVDIIPNRNSTPAVLLRESHREGDKIKKRTVANLSALSKEQIEDLRLVLKGRRLAPVDELFEAVRSPHHGHVHAVLLAMKRLGFDRLLASRRSRQRDLVVAMVVARVVVAESKLATSRWWQTTTLPETLELGESDEDALYEAMDWLLERQPHIEKKLAARHLADDALALYDLSSSYFEGNKCPLAALGHNRDGKKGKLQVNYGLLTDPCGRPVAVSVFRGNVGDPKTLLFQVDKVREEFAIQRIVLVGDRGMITQKQVNALRDIKGVDWITALRPEPIRKLVTAGSVQMGLFDERGLFEITHPDFPGERLVACRNVELAARRGAKRRSLLAATCRELDTVRRMTQRGRLHGKQNIGERIRKALGRAQVAQHLRVDIRDDGFDFEFDEAKVVVQATRVLVRELTKVRRMIERGRLAGKQDIAKRVAKAINKRKAGQHFQFDIRDDGFDFEVDKAKVVADATHAVVTKLAKVRTATTRGRLHGQDAIGLRTGRVVNKYRVAKHFKLDIQHDTFDFEIDEEKVAAEATLDGIYIVRTSLPAEQMTSEDTVRSYKLLSRVERAFRSFKTIDLKVRPIYHRLEKRVRAHIFLCMLAYYVQWHMLEAWRPLLFSDEDQAAKATRDPVAPAKRSDAALRKIQSKKLEDGTTAHSFRTLLLDLSTIVRNKCRRPGAPSSEPTFDVDITPSAKQKMAFDLLAAIKL